MRIYQHNVLESGRGQGGAADGDINGPGQSHPAYATSLHQDFSGLAPRNGPGTSADRSELMGNEVQRRDWLRAHNKRSFPGATDRRTSHTTSARTGVQIRRHERTSLSRCCALHTVTKSSIDWTPKMLDVKLRELGATDGTLRKAASFFINALKATDVQVPSAIARKARNDNRKSTIATICPGISTVNSSDSQPSEMSSIASFDGRTQFFQGTRKLGEDALGNDVVATLTISGPFLNMANSWRNLIGSNPSSRRSTRAVRPNLKKRRMPQIHEKRSRAKPAKR